MRYKYVPNTKEDLLSVVWDRISYEGNGVDLNDIDVSGIKDLSHLFYEFKEFNGDISRWDVSNAEVMDGMFFCSHFNGDLSKWNVSNVKSMFNMFSHSDFNGDISMWDVSNVEDMGDMFCKNLVFDQDLSGWDTRSCYTHDNMFDGSPMQKQKRRQPKFKKR
jgi:surface protein